MICGVDEAGRGPVIGPMIIAGVKLENQEILKQMNVRDSKKISPNQRKIIAEKIKEISEFHFEKITAKQIDDLRNIISLNEIEVHGFVKVIKKLKPDIAYVDAADVNEQRFKNNIQNNLNFNLEIISKHKADSIFPVVSAASIIAKTVRDSEVEKIGQELNSEIGSGYPSDPKTRDFLIKWVEKEGELPPYTRYSWETAKKVLKNYHNKLNITKLEQFMED